MARSLQGLMYARKICAVDALGKWEHGHLMWLCCVVAGLAIFALQVLLGDLHISQSHLDIFVSEQLHQCWKADPQSDHLGREAVAKPVGRNMAGTSDALGNFI